MLAPEVIRRKRDGGTLTTREIEFLVGGITDGGLSDAQVGALAMAFFLRGLEAEERLALTIAMRDSGTVLRGTSTGPSSTSTRPAAWATRCR